MRQQFIHEICLSFLTAGRVCVNTPRARVRAFVCVCGFLKAVAASPFIARQVMGKVTSGGLTQETMLRLCLSEVFQRFYHKVQPAVSNSWMGDVKLFGRCPHACVDLKGSPMTKLCV